MNDHDHNKLELEFWIRLILALIALGFTIWLHS